MILVVGLGNPGEKYAHTRHNLGFIVLDEFLRKITPVEKTRWRFDRKSNSQLAVPNSQLILAKPQTMVNASGFAVARLAKRHQLSPNRVWVIHDDIDLPLGKLKIRVGGASAGHKGVESVINQLGTDYFARFRLGAGRPGLGLSESEVTQHVLSGFRSREQRAVRRLIKKTLQALKVALENDLAVAMNRFN